VQEACVAFRAGWGLREGYVIGSGGGREGMVAKTGEMVEGVATDGRLPSKEGEMERGGECGSSKGVGALIAIWVSRWCRRQKQQGCQKRQCHWERQHCRKRQHCRRQHRRSSNVIGSG